MIVLRFRFSSEFVPILADFLLRTVNPRVGMIRRYRTALCSHLHVDHHVAVLVLQIVAMENVGLVASEVV